MIYNVVVTVREHWTIRVEADTAPDARAKVERGDYTSDDCFAWSDRVFVGLRVLREAEA